MGASCIGIQGEQERLLGLLEANDEAIIDRLISDARAAGFGADLTSDRAVARRTTEAVLMPVLKALAGGPSPSPLLMGDAYELVPLTEPIFHEFRRQREHGASLEELFGFIKCLRTAIVEIVGAQIDDDAERARSFDLLARLFDRLELAMAAAYAKETDNENETIADLRRTNRRLIADNAKYLTVINNIDAPLVAYRPRVGVFALNTAAATEFGNGDEKEANLFRPDAFDNPLIRELMVHFWRRKHKYANRRVTMPVDGEERVYLVRLRRVPSANEAYAGCVAIFHDITTMDRLQKTLHDERAIHESILETVSDVIIACDDEGRLILANRAAREHHIGVAPSVPPDEWAEHYQLHAADGDRLLDRDELPMLRALAGEKVDDFEMRIGHPEEGQISVIASGAPLVDANGQGRGAVLSLRDITDRKRAEREITRMAFRDTLTGLANRALFLDRLSQATARLNRNGTPFALHLIDVDHFKDINDTHGHSVGDALLRTLAERLLLSVRASDTVARIGGDEFAIIQADTASVQTGALLADRIQRSITEPITIGSVRVAASVSGGIVIADDDTLGTEVLMERADVALYQAKEDGRGTFKFHTHALSDASRHKLRIVDALRRAVEENRFHLAYQPQFSLKTGECVAIEALLRWRFAGLDGVGPAEFIKIAEDHSLMGQVGELVLDLAFDQVAAWREEGIDVPRLAINLSAVQLRDKYLPDRLARRYEIYGLEPGAIEFELTESALVGDEIVRNNVLEPLNRLGVEFSIDDFGTGYSSLIYLKNLPLNRLKIAREFVADMEQDQNDRAIVEAIISIADRLRLETVAEGVERETQATLLAEMGADIAQGYHFARPMLADAMGDFLRTGMRPLIAVAGGGGRARIAK